MSPAVEVAPARPTPRTQPAAEPPVAAGVHHLLPFALVDAALTVATYLYYGYAYGSWPGTAMLDFVVRVKGDLGNDWQTDQPAPHWAMTHLLALFPEAWLEGAVLSIWIVGLLVLWGGFAVICRALGMGWAAVLGAGLVAVPTGFGGIGWSEPLFGSMYPSQTAFAFSVAAVAAAALSRCALAGVLVGVAMLVHPSAGLLAVPVVAAVLLPMVNWRWRGLARFTVPLVALAVPALIPVAAAQSDPSTLSPQERFELLAIVRQPHHVLYSQFGSYEYARTALWLGLVVVGVALLRRRPTTRALGLGTLAALLGLVIGGIASEAEGPVLVLQAQLSRMSPFVVLFGIVLGAAALAALSRIWGTAALFGLALLAHPIANELSGRLVSVSGVEALALLIAIGAAGVVVLTRKNEDARFARALTAVGFLVGVTLLVFALGSPSYRNHIAGAGIGSWLRPTAVLVSLALVLAAALIWRGIPRLRTRYRGYVALRLGVIGILVAANGIALAKAEAYVATSDPVHLDWRQIAAVTRAVTEPEDVVLTPPQNFGFRFFSHRPVVVEAGSFRYDSEDVNWARRIADVTGDARTVAASFGTDVAARNALMAKAYDRQVERSDAQICKYGVAYVVAEAPVAVPPWLLRVAANSTYVLLRVKPETCPA